MTTTSSPPMPRPTDRLKQRSGIEMRALPKGALLVDMNTGRCFRLNHVGAEVWSLLAERQDFGDVCRTVANRYRRPIEAVTNEVRRLVEQLTRENLLVASEAHPAP
jgi:hypothetical protein